MAKSVYYCAIFLIQLFSLGDLLGQGFHELQRPYFCSTCFTTTQDQNYHCCFYFFRCCAEARFGSRSTTPNPGYPGLPSGITFFVQNRNARPCSAVDCKDVEQASNLCCRMPHQNAADRGNSPYESGDGGGVFKPAFELVEADGDSVEESTRPISADVGSTTPPPPPEDPEAQEFDPADENSSKARYRNLGLEITGSPFRQNLRQLNSEKRIFHAPSLIFDHESEDANRGGQNWKKRGWYTKDILSQEGRH